MIEWFGPVIREAYGGAESGTISSISTEEWLRKPGSVGRPFEQFEAVVVDDSGSPVPVGRPGRLFFRDASGQGIAYHDDPEKTAGAHLAPGVFTLGDVGHVDEDGYLFVGGRSIDMVISGGVNIYPAECERVLREHEQVLDAVVFGVPDAEMGERLVGLVVVAGAVDAVDLLAYCRDRIAHYKVPRELRVVDEIPRSLMGKVDKKALAADHVETP
jgi:long-chain acyl-CoA synthetase